MSVRPACKDFSAWVDPKFKEWDEQVLQEMRSAATDGSIGKDSSCYCYCLLLCIYLYSLDCMYAFTFYTVCIYFYLTLDTVSIYCC
jgi:hypothetical protein